MAVAQLGLGDDVLVRAAVERRCVPEVKAVWSGDVLLEGVGLGGHGQEVKDPATIVVQEHDRQVEVQPARGQQPPDVVGQGDVADQQHHRPFAGRGRAEGAGHPCRRCRWRAAV